MKLKYRILYICCIKKKKLKKGQLKSFQERRLQHFNMFIRFLKCLRKVNRMILLIDYMSMQVNLMMRKLKIFSPRFILMMKRLLISSLRKYFINHCPIKWDRWITFNIIMNSSHNKTFK